MNKREIDPDFEFSGLSKTTSKAEFYNLTPFSDFYDYGQDKQVKRIPKKFLEWFIGFFEADGSFSDEKTFDKRSGWVGTRIRIAITQNEKEILELVQQTFGFGNVHSCGKSNWQWKVESKNELEALAFFFWKFES